MQAVRAIRHHGPRGFSWWNFGVGIISAGVVGALANIILETTGLALEWRIVCVSMAGYAGGSILDVSYHGLLLGIVVFWGGVSCRIYKYLHKTDACPQSEYIERAKAELERIESHGMGKGYIRTNSSGRGWYPGNADPGQDQGGQHSNAACDHGPEVGPISPKDGKKDR